MAFAVGTAFGPNHDGIDFLTPIGTPIGAPVDGQAEVRRAVSEESGKYVSYGLHVLIFAGRYTYVMAHLSSVAITNGPIKRGALVGKTGKTGNATGPHLHYEVRFNDQPINPAGFTGSLFSPSAQQTRGSRAADAATDACIAALRKAALANRAIGADGLKFTWQWEKVIFPSLCSQVTSGSMTQAEATAIIAKAQDPGQAALAVAEAYSPANALGVLGGLITSPLGFLQLLASGKLWVRVAMVLGGATLGVVALVMIGKQVGVPIPAPPALKVAAKVAKAAA